MWIQRVLKGQIEKSSLSRPVILLTGMRQTGKSSLLKRLFPSATYVTFDHYDQLDEARESGEDFLEKFSDSSVVILDEVQYVPELFRSIKLRVDEDRGRYGKWILTGSQQFALMKDVSDSLAGRVSVMHLETLSAHELRKSDDVKSLDDYLWKGGFPEIWSNTKLDFTDFFESYIRTYIERDLKEIINVNDLRGFRRLIKALAVRVGQLVNYSDISKDIGVSDVAVRKWVHALEASGLIYLLSPYYANLGKRLVKSPKIYFSDHGLLSHLLGVSNVDDFEKHLLKGGIWENLVLMELVKVYQLRPSTDVFFYRDSKGVEIDFLIEIRGKIHLIEAKSSVNIPKEGLNFEKVASLLKEKDIAWALFHRSRETKVVKRKGFNALNPIKTDYRLE